MDAASSSHPSSKGGGGASSASSAGAVGWTGVLSSAVSRKDAVSANWESRMYGMPPSTKTFTPLPLGSVRVGTLAHASHLKDHPSLMHRFPRLKTAGVRCNWRAWTGKPRPGRAKTTRLSTQMSPLAVWSLGRLLGGMSVVGKHAGVSSSPNKSLPLPLSNSHLSGSPSLRDGAETAAISLISAANCPACSIQTAGADICVLGAVALAPRPTILLCHGRIQTTLKVKTSGVVLNRTR